MDELIKKIRESELDFEGLISLLESWSEQTDLKNIDEVIEDLDYHLTEEISASCFGDNYENYN